MNRRNRDDIVIIKINNIIVGVSILFLVSFYVTYWNWNGTGSFPRINQSKAAVFERESSVDDVNSNSNSDATSKNWIDPFEEQPGCLLLIELATIKAGTQTQIALSMRSILNRFGKYVPVAPSHRPRYDHRSCVIMKPRYNCARINSSNATAAATDFALVLEDPKAPSSSSSSVCDLQKFVLDAGGPAGVGRRMMHNYQKAKENGAADGAPKHGHSNDTTEESSPIEVLLVGTSRLRQIFEALACGFSDQMTDLRLQWGGPVPTKFNPIMKAEAIGPLVGWKVVANGACYQPEAQANYSKFFRNGTDVPKNHEYCNDNIGIVEFGDRNGDGDGDGDATNRAATPAAATTSSSTRGRNIRFYYIFRPWDWTNITAPFEKLGIDQNHKMDFVLWEPKESNNFTSSSGVDIYRSLFDIRSTTTPTPPSTKPNKNSNENTPTNLHPATTSNIERHDLHDLYQKIQTRDAGQYFGADNPWITHPPDNSHPCMPGQPDDKVNFLLWYMLSLSAIEREATD